MNGESLSPSSRAPGEETSVLNTPFLDHDLEYSLVVQLRVTKVYMHQPTSGEPETLKKLETAERSLVMVNARMRAIEEHYLIPRYSLPKVGLERVYTLVHESSEMGLVPAFRRRVRDFFLPC